MESQSVLCSIGYMRACEYSSILIGKTFFRRPMEPLDIAAFCSCLAELICDMCDSLIHRVERYRATISL